MNGKLHLKQVMIAGLTAGAVSAFINALLFYLPCSWIKNR